MTKIALAFIAAAMAVILPAQALPEERMLVPRATLYPGDSLATHMFAAAGQGQVPHGMLREGMLLEGLTARRTLPAGEPVPLLALQSARVVRNGSRITILFQQQGLTISTTGQALEHGSVGDMIRVRNAQSGLTVSGRILDAGHILVHDR